MFSSAVNTSLHTHFLLITSSPNSISIFFLYVALTDLYQQVPRNRKELSGVSDLSLIPPTPLTPDRPEYCLPRFPFLSQCISAPLFFFLPILFLICLSYIGYATRNVWCRGLLIRVKSSQFSSGCALYQCEQTIFSRTHLLHLTIQFI